MIGDDEPTTMSHAVHIGPGIDFRDKAEALEGFEVRRVVGDLIEDGVAAKGRFFFGHQMDGREIRMRHDNNPFQGDYSTDAPRGARPAQGGSRMKEQRIARGGIRRLIERNFEENIPAIRVVWESQIQSAGAAGERSPSNPSDHLKEEVQGRGKCSSIPRW